MLSISDMFHPDNIKNFSAKDPEVSNSLETYWHQHGGSNSLAKKLKTNLKVCFSDNFYKSYGCNRSVLKVVEMMFKAENRRKLL